jgi:phosphoribosylanthranilate isomerase
MVKVKFCGITNERDAFRAVRLGVDVLGFIFAPSPRKIDPEEACRIIYSLPPFVQTVGVFVNEGRDTIRELKQFCGFQWVQLHGDEPPEMCRQLMPHVIKAFQIRDESSLLTLKDYQPHVRSFLLDTYSKEKRGGTAKTFDWDLALKCKNYGIPIILSGGLEPSNIERAISKVRPYAVDINSGIEDSPGQKSPILMKKLMEKIKGMIGEFNGLETGDPKNDR